MTGAVGLHGGGEYVEGDEPFLELLLGAARVSAAARAAACGRGSERGSGDPIHVAILPTAAAGSDPDRAGAVGAAAFDRVARRTGAEVRVAVVPVTDARSAATPAHAARLAAADLIHLPGGEPDRVPAVLRDTPAWRAVLAARARGAVVAGASAGAMALGEWTWSSGGPIAGLAVVRGLVVIPHFEERERHPGTRALLARIREHGLGALGLDVRTGVLGAPGRGDEGSDDAPAWGWRVAGPGTATWLPARGRANGSATTARDGDVLRLPGVEVGVGA